MKNKELIAALSKCDPEAPVSITIKQYNKSYGRTVYMEESTIARGVSSYEFDVDQYYSGCNLTVHLPGKAIIANWP
jgi:hypothetical protein